MSDCTTEVKKNLERHLMELQEMIDGIGGMSSIRDVSLVAAYAELVKAYAQMMAIKDEVS